MANEFMGALADRHAGPSDHFAIAPGIVTNNFDALGEARVQVRIPALPGFEPWARISAVGAGSSRGFCWIPQVGDEVLVAFAQNDAAAAYILGGLWSTGDRPPITLPPEFITKQVIQTLAGHSIEFDNLQQSVTITTSTQQKITMDPLKIELSGSFGALSVKLDGSSQTISIQAAATLELKAPQISIEGLTVEIKGTEVSINGAGPVSVQGLPIKLN